MKILRNHSSVSRLIHFSSSLKICLICYSFVFNLSCVENKKHLCVIYCRSETKHFSQKPELNITLILHKFYPFQYPVLPPPLLYTFTFISFNSILLNKTLQKFKIEQGIFLRMKIEDFISMESNRPNHLMLSVLTCICCEDISVGIVLRSGLCQHSQQSTGRCQSTLGLVTWCRYLHWSLLSTHI